jgi:CRP-like cAMP-binding protein
MGRTARFSFVDGLPADTKPMLHTSSSATSPQQYSKNGILADLPTIEIEQLAPHLHPLLLHHGDTLTEVQDHCDWVYFPKAGVISVVVVAESGMEVEAGLVGSEGAACVVEAMSHSPAVARYVVQVPGSGWRIGAQTFREQLKRMDALQERVWLHQHTLMAIATQSALCNRLHALEARLARWLLSVDDRVDGQSLEITHEFIGDMLGTRRVGVTEALGTLRNSGLIETHRGSVLILDRKGVEASACECYSITRNLIKRSAPKN